MPELSECQSEGGGKMKHELPIILYNTYGYTIYRKFVTYKEWNSNTLLWKERENTRTSGGETECCRPL